jgi:hypothetical protein
MLKPSKNEDENKVERESLHKLFEYVDAFIQRLYDKEWEVSTDARTIQIRHPITDERGNLAELTANAITDYEDKGRAVSSAIIKARFEIKQEELPKNYPAEPDDAFAEEFEELREMGNIVVPFLIMREEVLPKIRLKEDAARNCLALINTLFTNGLVIEGEALARKLKDCQENNAHLIKENRKLSEAYEQLRKAHEEYQKRVRPPHNDEDG